MPLDRNHVTTASRVMLPTYVTLAAYFGVLYLTDPQGRLERAPGLAFARMLLPMPAWGCLFLAVATLMATALVKHQRLWFLTALWVYLVCAAAWAGVYLGAVFITPDASYGGPAWPLFVAAACYATSRSLLRGER